MPSLTCPDRTSRTVIFTESPIRMFSPNFRVRTSIEWLPPRRAGTASTLSNSVSARNASDLTGRIPAAHPAVQSPLRGGPGGERPGRYPGATIGGRDGARYHVSPAHLAADSGGRGAGGLRPEPARPAL